jgi:hypothetical protein
LTAGERAIAGTIVIIAHLNLSSDLSKSRKIRRSDRVLTIPSDLFTAHSLFSHVASALNIGSAVYFVTIFPDSARLFEGRAGVGIPVL